ncbi:MAG: alpha/beta hydrolase [Actinobacteria bacterium]|nr:alpha/beta hydrolase [Actinomycetota bacterium]
MKTFETSAGTMAYDDLGDPDAKPVLMLHGFPTNRYLWRNVAPLLATRFRVIVPDLLGYGTSSKKAEAQDLTIRAQTRYQTELLDELNVHGELAVVGHDIGGGVAQLLAFDGRASAAVLIDSISLDSWPIEGVRMIQASEPQDATPEFADNLVRMAIDLGVSHKERLTEDALSAYAAPFVEHPEALIRAARAIDGEGLVGSEMQLAALEQNLLVLWGADDPYQEEELAIRFSDLVPGATVGILPGCSHFLTEDAPETVGPLIYEWLRVRYQREPHHHAGDTGPADVSFERPEPSEDFG